MTAQDTLPYPIQKATDDIKRILDETREPKFFAKTSKRDHTYDDKYSLAEYVVNVGLVTLWNALDIGFGLDEIKLRKLLNLSNNGKKSITLRFIAHETCTFLREEEVELNDPAGLGMKVKTTITKKKHGHMGFNTTKETTVVATAMDFHWKLQTNYKILAYVGSWHQNNKDGEDDGDNKSNVVLLKEGQFGGDVVQRGVKRPPRPEQSVITPKDVPVTLLFKLLEVSGPNPKEGNEEATTEAGKKSYYSCRFMIDREASKTCRTPWNNNDVQNLRGKILDPIRLWATQVSSYFKQYAKSLPHQDTKDDSPYNILRKEVEKNSEQIFIPIFPFFDDSESTKKLSEELKKTHEHIASPIEGSQGEKKNDDDLCDSFLARVPKQARFFESGTPIFSAADTSLLLNEHRQTLMHVQKSLGSQGNESIVKTLNGKDLFVGCVVMKHLGTVTNHIHQGVYCIERALEDQLIEAIGKRIHSSDFDEYMTYHNSRLLKLEYSPKPFCYSIRRPNHYPEGTLSILKTNESTNASFPSGNYHQRKEPRNHGDKVYETLSRKIEDTEDVPMNLPINAATTVQVNGDRYVHAILTHEFDHLRRPVVPAHEPSRNIELVARARQFSSFMMVLGNISGPNTFDPSDAIILQNKDELIIPLLLEQMPSAKEFKDAISSMSPEQQRFARSFRQKQLSSSIFGIMIIQLKPQLELLLNLPKDSLTKEVKLTQSLLELFIEYQIPSDLLTYDPAAAADDGVLVNASGDSNDSVSDKVSAVKRYVKNVEEMIKEAKTKVVEEETRKAEMRHATNFAPGFGASVQRQSSASDGPPGRDSLLSFASLARSRPPGMAVPMAVPSGAASFALSASAPLSCAVPGNTLEQRSGRLLENEYVEACEESDVCEEWADDVAEDFDFQPSSQQEVERSKEGDHDHPLETPKKEESFNATPTSTKLDVSLLPKLLDSKFEQLGDEFASLRPTKIQTAPEWKKKFYKNILSKQESKIVTTEEQREYKNKAFDLLDALSRSGSLTIPFGELHVMVAATHCFDRTLIDTVIHDNCNPIEPFERSVLVVASVLHGSSSSGDGANTSEHRSKDIVDLIASPNDTKRILSLSPKLLTNTSTSSTATTSPI
jgi:gas vesicle protein